MIGTYYRLSLADEDVGADKAESNSIQGQRGLVEGYIMARPELAAEPRQEYVDDGYSGTSTSRPAFQRLIQDAQDCHNEKNAESLSERTGLAIESSLVYNNNIEIQFF